MRVHGRWSFRYRDVVTGEERQGGVYENQICLNGCAVLAALLNGEGPALGLYGAVGTGSAIPSFGDTQLAAEYARVALAASSRASNVTSLEFFFLTSQANTTITECGAFLTATATANSGQLLSHALISETKNDTETMTIEVAVTFSA